MSKHNGPIEIKSIENKGLLSNKAGLLKAQFVQYPDCQQLKIWLPVTKHLKWDYKNYYIIDLEAQIIIQQGKAQEIISGNVEILIDTLEFPESQYVFEIESPKDCIHCLYFQKFSEEATIQIESQKKVEKEEDWRLMGW
ncbi:MAG TPA: hypothetical protein PK006_04575 [Saprospiraceae bacterium]|nr:hypothetical protein [Saprospiraceae bacterium]